MARPGRSSSTQPLKGPARQWERFGEIDPYYGVFTGEEFRAENLDDTARQRFFESGERHVEGVFESIRAHIDPQFSPARAIDYGCGVGRVALALAGRCGHVTGIDVSPPMLAEAQRNAQARAVENVSWAGPADLDAQRGQADLVHSVIVFQHMPRAQGEQAVASLLRALRPGGVAALHFPYRSVSWKVRLRSWAGRHVPPAHNVRNLLARRPWSYPHMQMNEYPLGRLAALFAGYGARWIHVDLAPREDDADFEFAMLYARIDEPGAPVPPDRWHK